MGLKAATRPSYSYKAYMQLLGLEQLLGLLAAAWEYRPLIGLHKLLGLHAAARSTRSC